MEHLGNEEYVQVALQLVPHISDAAHLARCCTSSWRLLWHDASLWRAFCVQCFEFWRSGVSPERLSLPALTLLLQPTRGHSGINRHRRISSEACWLRAWL